MEWAIKRTWSNGQLPDYWYSKRSRPYMEWFYNVRPDERVPRECRYTDVANAREALKEVRQMYPAASIPGGDDYRIHLVRLVKMGVKSHG